MSYRNFDFEEEGRDDIIRREIEQFHQEIAEQEWEELQREKDREIEEASWGWDE